MIERATKVKVEKRSGSSPNDNQRLYAREIKHLQDYGLNNDDCVWCKKAKLLVAAGVLKEGVDF